MATPDEPQLPVMDSTAATSMDEKDLQDNEDTPQSEEDQLTRAQIFLLMLSLCVATFIAAIEQTIVSTALPTIAKSFSASSVDYTWIGAAYLLPAAAATPSWNKVSDIFGRKPIIFLAVFVFFIGSLIAALAINIHMLIAGRVLQGTGGGGILSLSATVIGDVFSPRTRSNYFGVLGIVWGLACGLGPIVGGAFSEFVTWRWCFWINLPIAGLAGVFIFFFLKVETPRTPLLEGLKAIDWFGTISISGATIMFLLGLVYGGVAFPWNSATVICLVIFGVVTFGVFLFIEWRFAKYPIIPLRIFKQPSNIAAIGIAFLHGFIFIADLFYLPLYFQSVLGASPILSGVYLLPVAITLCIVSTGTGLYISKTGRYRPPIYFGILALILGHGLYINLPNHPSWSRIIIYQIISGFGIGPLFQAPIIAVFSLTKPADIASAAATVFFARDIAQAMSVIIGGVIFQNRMQAHSEQLSSVLPLATVHMLTDGDATASTELVQSLPDSEKQVVHTAYTESLSTIWIFFTALGAVALLLSVLISKQVLSREHKIGKTGLAVQEVARQEEEGKRLDATSNGAPTGV